VETSSNTTFTDRDVSQCKNQSCTFFFDSVGGSSMFSTMRGNVGCRKVNFHFPGKLITRTAVLRSPLVSLHIPIIGSMDWLARCCIRARHQASFLDHKIKEAHIGRRNPLMKSFFPIFVLASEMAKLPKIFSTNALFSYIILYAARA